MYELIQLNENDYFIDCPSRVGIVKISDSEVCLIDSGNDKDVGKKIKRHLDANGWTLKAIYNTHFHADHIGANKYLAEQTGCKIFARGVDSALIRHTILEPVTLCGSMPQSELLGKFLVAPQSEAEYLTEADLPSGFEMIDLAGHTFDMVGFKTPGGTVFLADAISSRETLDKYKIGVIYDVERYLKTLDFVKEIEGAVFVPSHVCPTEDIGELVEYNRKKVLEIADKICEIISGGMNFDSILQRLFLELDLKMTFEQHALVGSTVRSYLTYLKNAGRAEPYFENNILMWKAL
ncbi:MAG: MBL fold metallo-hydrolase [Clostridia bacterium]|nr:MBL fold metallo-hydrolase [Clostridia bacterium]